MSNYLIFVQVPLKHEKESSLNCKKKGLIYLIIKYKNLHMIKSSQQKLRTNDELGKIGATHMKK